MGTEHLASSIRSGSAAVVGLASILLVACASAPAPASARAPTLATPATPAATAATAAVAAPARANPPLAAAGLYRSMEAAREPPSGRELEVIASAKALLGQKPNSSVIVKGKQFTLDCIGTVSAIFYRVDIDVTKDFDKYSGNGVNRLYMTLKDNGVLHRDTYPRPGDVVIWDNTWDANGDGDRTDDPRTHAGVVLSVDDDGTINYVHENLYSGVVIEEMNLLKPGAAWDDSGKRLNSGMAIATVSGGAKPERWLSGDVFDSFGDVLRIAGRLKVAEAPAPPDAIVTAER
jgi:hypothetical protein